VPDYKRPSDVIVTRPEGSNDETVRRGDEPVLDLPGQIELGASGSEQLVRYEREFALDLQINERWAHLNTQLEDLKVFAAEPLHPWSR
jgi:hypothetical protein